MSHLPTIEQNMIDTGQPANVPPVTPEPDHVALDAPELVADIRALNKIKSERKKLADIEAPILERVKQRLEDAGAEDLTIDGHLMATYRQSKAPQTFDSTRFKKEHPALFLAFSKVGRPRRSFLLKDGPRL